MAPYVITLSVLTQSADPFDPGPSPKLMRHPTVNQTSIVFSFAGDLWSVPRTGGDAIRLTTSPGVESEPFFSPDGSTIAFSADYDGNRDVYVMDARGGIPKRLTHHPADDMTLGWSPDGKSILFSSTMKSAQPMPRLFTIPVGGGIPKELPTPSGTQVSMSPDMARIAYVPGFKWQEAWKRYRGGQTFAIWVMDLKDSKWKEIPRRNSNDEQPMWVGGDVYFISDRRGPTGLYKFDVGANKVSEVVPGRGFDIKSATANQGVIVYERLGSIRLYDPKTKSDQEVPIDIRGDFPEVRPQFKNVLSNLSSLALSPNAKRILVSARGNLLSIPAEKGDVRDLFDRQGVAERSPAYSPDGRSIAYITDESGSYRMRLFDVESKKERDITLGDGKGFYSSLIFSPDSKRIAYTDNKHQVWVMEVDSGLSKVIDAGLYEDPNTSISPAWSADSAWLTWSRDLENHLNAVFVYEVASGKVTQVTDALANAKSPAFDRNGKYLYFFASTNTGLAASYLDLSSFSNLNVVSSVYAVVLQKDGPNPLAPESDEETPRPAETRPAMPPVTPPGNPPGTPIPGQPGTPPPGAAQAAPPQTPAAQTPATPPGPKPMVIDFDGISQRIVALPMPAQEYLQLEAGPAGSLFILASPPRATVTSPAVPTLLRFTMAARRASAFAAGVGGFALSATGNQILLLQGSSVAVVPTQGPPPQPGQGALDISDLTVRIDPVQEWRQMYHEVWRNERIYFYDPGLHGINADQMEKRYEPFLANVRSREDLNYLFTDMLGELSIGHMFIGGGDIPGVSFVPGGLLGADYEFVNGKYRLARIYDGENWNPAARAPLTAPGVNAKVGEYILAIDGNELTDTGDIYALLERKAGRQVTLKIGPNADGSGSREVVVVPVASENGLRQLAWREDNRRRVEAATGGKIGYVWVPDTNIGGWTNFNRFYFAQTGKQGIIVDERFNQGGLINDFMVFEMTKTLQGVFRPRSGKDWATPGTAIFGPKVMLANQFAGSGGDMFPWLFKNQKVGPVVGKRTWGGLVRAFGFQLVDGGSVRAPDVAFFNPHEGTWDVEGWGVEPDIEVEYDPYLWRQGKDAQLERAIEEIVKAMKSYPYPQIKSPAYPDRTKLDVRF